ncbi:hypothetical protein FFLO_03458 [Filobasidium floriforme]|uniref:Elongin-C n=1 Tax=Filobasidium floriforme TaxID=5210 RepID=A0A8K0JKR4_9TREE|nr:BTB/POZ protein [Filobasidium floriforme]KAG7539659.1 hypothetical protein FFLO_03458 [Filobasidium floriforme]KAH8084798.1 BTB/POZ protein [Filobasidium floriforme]
MTSLANDLEQGWVRINSIDGYSFVIPKTIAFGSGVIKSSLDESANFAEVATQTIKLDYRGIIVGKIVEYLHFKHAYKDTAQKEIQEDFSERIEPELALELLMAADFIEA